MTYTEIRELIASMSARNNPEGDAMSRIRNLPGKVGPKGKGGRSGAGAAKMTTRDAVMVLLSMGAPVAKDAAEYVEAVARLERKPDNETLVETLSNALEAFIESDSDTDIRALPRLVRVPCVAIPSTAEVVWHRDDGTDEYRYPEQICGNVRPFNGGQFGAIAKYSYIVDWVSFDFMAFMTIGYKFREEHDDRGAAPLSHLEGESVVVSADGKN